MDGWTYIKAGDVQVVLKLPKVSAAADGVHMLGSPVKLENERTRRVARQS